MTDSTRLTQERLQELLSYDSNTGQFRWRQTRGPNAKRGHVAGHVSKHYGGRVAICIDNRTYQASRLGWLHVHGSFPQGEVYYKDGDATNASIGNLTLCPRPKGPLNPRHALSASRLKELLHFDCDTGLWSWREDRNNMELKGKQAGFIDGQGNLVICVEAKQYRAARLAYLFVTGEWPTGRVYRLDGDNSNDRWDNLTCSKQYAERQQQNTPAKKVQQLAEEPKPKQPKKKKGIASGLIKAIARLGTGPKEPEEQAWTELCHDAPEPYVVLPAAQRAQRLWHDAQLEREIDAFAAELEDAEINTKAAWNDPTAKALRKALRDNEKAIEALELAQRNLKELEALLA